MSELGTKIIAAGLVDEGIEVEAMQRELASLKALLGNDKPKCPFCLKLMEPREYRGYYDSFHYWECGCDVLPGADQWEGSYA